MFLRKEYHHFCISKKMGSTRSQIFKRIVCQLLNRPSINTFSGRVVRAPIAHVNKISNTNQFYICVTDS